jgi:hypothetical protein
VVYDVGREWTRPETALPTDLVAFVVDDLAGRVRVARVDYEKDQIRPVARRYIRERGYFPGKPVLIGKRMDHDRRRFRRIIAEQANTHHDLTDDHGHEKHGQESPPRTRAHQGPHT